MNRKMELFYLTDEEMFGCVAVIDRLLSNGITCSSEVCCFGKRHHRWIQKEGNDSKLSGFRRGSMRLV